MITGKLLNSSIRTCRSRRGSIYVVTLATTMMVAALGIAAISTVRVQRKQAAEADSARQAQLHAESALQLARYRIKYDSQWRTRFSSNTWSSDQPIGNGTYSFTAEDPVDGDITDNNLDPVVVTAIGKERDSTHRLAYEFKIAGMNCLQSGLHSEADLEFHNVTATASGAPFTSNQDVRVDDNSQVYANCAAVDQVNLSSNGQVFGNMTNGIQPRQMPDAASVLSHYQGLGTTILATALPLWDQNYVTNSGAESNDVAPWVPSNCDAVASTSQARSGNYSFYIYNRSLLADGTIRQDVTSKIRNNVKYDVSGWVFDPNLLGLDSFRLHVLLQTSNGNVSYTSGWQGAQFNNWTGFSFSPTLTWTGNLIKAEIYIQSLLGLFPHYLDDIAIQEAGAQSSTRVVHRQLFSPQSNPFTGALNGQGIYVLNCGGNKIHIQDTRILGTLVILNPGIGSKIEGSVCWDPTVALSTDPSVPNLPALVTDGQLEIGLNSTALSETTTDTNFNPAGSPYAGVSDVDVADNYPSQISGVLFSSTDLMLSKYTTINGSAVGATRLIVNGTSPAASGVTVNHQPLYYYVNPPIGFRTMPTVKLKSGSAEQIVQ